MWLSVKTTAKTFIIWHAMHIRKESNSMLSALQWINRCCLYSVMQARVPAEKTASTARVLWELQHSSSILWHKIINQHSYKSVSQLTVFVCAQVTHYVVLSYYYIVWFGKDLIPNIDHIWFKQIVRRFTGATAVELLSTVILTDCVGVLWLTVVLLWCALLYILYFYC